MKYIKNTRIPIKFLINVFKDTGNIDDFIKHYPWLKPRKKELINLILKESEKKKKKLLIGTGISKLVVTVLNKNFTKLKVKK